MEDDLKKRKKGRWPHKKIEDDLFFVIEKLEWRTQKNGRQPQKKMEDEPINQN